MLGGAIRAVECRERRSPACHQGGPPSRSSSRFVEKLKEWFGSALALLKKVLGIAEKEVPSPALCVAKGALAGTSAGPTLVPPDANGPTLVPDDSMGSDWDADER